MMFLTAVMLGMVAMVASLTARPSPGISVVHREKRVVDQPESFSLGDLVHGSHESMPHGMEEWSSIFQGLRGAPMNPETLHNMMQKVGVDDVAGAYVDPELKQQLTNETVQKQIQNISSNKEVLTKIVQENPMVQQLLAIDPQLGKLVSNPEALQKIFSPEILEKVERGGLDEETLEGILETPNQQQSKNSIEEKTKNEDKDHRALIPKTMSSAPAMYLEGGLMLKEVKAGDGKTFPRDGDNLFVDYAGYLQNGQVFDSTQNGNLYSFQLGASQVIRGWEVAIRKMSLGERAVLRVPAAMAYGESGMGPIPPNSDLFFQVELHGINALTSN